MFREWGEKLARFLESIGVDVLLFATLIAIAIFLMNYKNLKNWQKLKWDEKLWIGAVTYGLITLIAINLLRLLGILDL